MIVNDKTRQFSSNVDLSSSHKFAVGDIQKIIAIIRDTGYTNKIKSAVREVYSNAIDANAMTDSPYKVLVGLTLEDFFSKHGQHQLYIRDFGPGLSHNDVCNVFAMYGVSTKEGAANQIGGFGIGAKSPFSYTDTFIVHSYYEGQHTTYCCYLDENSSAMLDILNQEPSDAETGLCIQIPIRSNDYNDFVTHVNFYTFFNNHLTDVCYFKDEEEFFEYKPVLKTPVFDITLKDNPEYSFKVRLIESDTEAPLFNPFHFYAINNVLYQSGDVSYRGKNQISLHSTESLTKKLISFSLAGSITAKEKNKFISVLPYINIKYGPHLDINAFRETFALNIDDGRTFDQKFYTPTGINAFLHSLTEEPEYYFEKIKDLSPEEQEKYYSLFGRLRDFYIDFMFLNSSKLNSGHKKHQWSFFFDILNTDFSKLIPDQKYTRYSLSLKPQEFLTEKILKHCDHYDILAVRNIHSENKRILEIDIENDLNKPSISFSCHERPIDESILIIFDDEKNEEEGKVLSSIIDLVSQKTQTHKYHLSQALISKLWPTIKRIYKDKDNDRYQKKRMGDFQISMVLKTDISHVIPFLDEYYQLDATSYKDKFKTMPYGKQDWNKAFVYVAGERIKDVPRYRGLLLRQHKKIIEELTQGKIKVSAKTPTTVMSVEQVNAERLQKQVLLKAYSNVQASSFTTGLSFRDIDFKDTNKIFVFYDGMIERDSSYRILKDLKDISPEIFGTLEKEVIIINTDFINPRLKLHEYTCAIREGFVTPPDHILFIDHLDLRYVVENTIPIGLLNKLPNIQHAMNSFNIPLTLFNIHNFIAHAKHAYNLGNFYSYFFYQYRTEDIIYQKPEVQEYKSYMKTLLFWKSFFNELGHEVISSIRQAPHTIYEEILNLTFLHSVLNGSKEVLCEQISNTFLPFLLETLRHQRLSSYFSVVDKQCIKEYKGLIF